jgi:phage-related protein
MKRFEELYFALWLSNDQTKWELLCGLHKGDGQKTVALFPAKTKSVQEQLPKMLEMVLYYLNNPASQHVLLPFEQRLREVCSREATEIIRVFWWNHLPISHIVDYYLQKQGEAWIEITKPNDFLTMNEYEMLTTHEKQEKHHKALALDSKTDSRSVNLEEIMTDQTEETTSSSVSAENQSEEEKKPQQVEDTPQQDDMKDTTPICPENNPDQLTLF